MFLLEKRKLIESSGQNIRDKYRLQRALLGQGTYGSVKTGVRLIDNQKVAVKVINKRSIAHNEMFAREMAVMKKADHPNIIRLLQTFQDFRFIYLVQELCEGGQLFEKIIQTGYLDQKIVVQIFPQMLSAVAYLHRLNIVHRDLKPQNFLFLNNDINSPLKLIDFGLAKSFQQGNLMKTRAGSCYYMSPEILRGAYTEKCDIWSLGVILYVMLSGYPPFNGHSDVQVIRNIQRGSWNFQLQEFQKVSEPAKDLIRRLLDNDISTRISATEALNHPWIVSDTPQLEQINLNQVIAYQKSKTFRKTVLNYMATQCSSNDLTDIINLFQALDVDRDGCISIKNMQHALSASDLELRGRLEELFNTLNLDPDGVINFNEFVSVMLDKRIYTNQEKLWQAFKRFDQDDSGKINAQKLREALDHQQSIDNSRIWSDMINEVDEEGFGEIGFEEFVNIMERVSVGEANVIRNSLQNPFD